MLFFATSCNTTTISFSLHWVISEFAVDDNADSDIFVDSIPDYADFDPPVASSEIDLQGNDNGHLLPSKNNPVGCRDADLLNAVKLQHNISDRAAINFLELMKVPGFNPQRIKHADIKQHKDVTDTSLISVVTRCSTCCLRLLDGLCPDNW